MPIPSHELQDRLASALTGQYTVERVLGVGGMGTVFLGRDVTLDRPVAIKVISPDVTGSAELRQRFLLEARTVARLRHPNIVSVYAAGESGDLLWFAMEYVPGESLRERQQRDGTMPADDVSLMMHDLALALDDAHAAGIVHRDVKPENILIDGETGRAMLTDFGVARALSGGDGRLTGVGFVLGSPRYMSPEQAAGDEHIDGRSDLYSLGLVSYEMLAGRPVVQATTPTAILAKHLTEDATPIAQVVADVPPVLADTIMRALRKPPEERFSRGRALAASLEGRDPDSPEVAAGKRVLGSARTRRPSAASRRLAMGAGAAAVVAAVLWMAFGGGANTASADETNQWLVAPFELQTANGSLDWLREGAVNMLGLTLAQWNDLRVVDYERTLDLLRTVRDEDQRRIGLEDARQIARRASAGSVVMGQITTANDSLFVVARRYDVASGDRIDEATVGAPLSGDPRLVFERLARELLDLAGAPVITVELTAQTTESVEAYRLYLDGLRALNRWQLGRADSLFGRALTIDTTFALAYYKRSLGLGWSNLLDSTYAQAAERAVTFGNRLPPRMREVVAGNLDLARGFLGVSSGDVQEARGNWASAQARFSALVATDSTNLDAWYGLADADFHAAIATNIVEADTIALLLNRSMLAFERTIAIDSSFHLAYQHLVSIYQIASNQRGLVVLDSGRLRARGAITDTTRVRQLRTAAQERSKRFAERWVAEDPDGAQAWQSLLDTYAVMQQFDSAVVLIGRARERETVYSPAMAYSRPIYRLLVNQPDSVRTDLMHTMARFPAESLGVRSVTPGVLLPLVGMTSASAVGATGIVDSLVELAVASASTIPILNAPTRDVAEWYAAASKLAAGAPATPAIRAALREGVTLLSDAGGRGTFAAQLRAQSLGVPYSGYLATRDSALAGAAVRWASDAGAQLSELDASLALDRGDTVAARTIAGTFAAPDVVRQATQGYAGLRVLTRADVLRRLGDLRGAAAMYEAIDPRNFLLALAEPGAALYVRSFLERARIYESLGERDKAIDAYQTFVRWWKNADAGLQGETREAQASLTRLLDASPAREIRPRSGGGDR